MAAFRPYGSGLRLAKTGVDVSPHLFRTAAASTAATCGGNTPHLASAVLHHTDPRVTEKHYNRPGDRTLSRELADSMNLHDRTKAIVRIGLGVIGIARG